MSTQLERLIEELRARGNRITKPRQWTLEVLYGENRHMTCEDIQQCLDERGVQVDEATIYRTLQWLKRNRVVSQMPCGAGPDVYALLGEQTHHHLICEECGSVSVVGDELFQALRDGIRVEHHFIPHIDHYAIFGLCADCYAKHQASSEAARTDTERRGTGVRAHQHHE